MTANIISKPLNIWPSENVHQDRALALTSGKILLVKRVASAANGAKYFGGLSLPKRCNTVRSEVLADLFTGKRLRSLDAVFASSTTRLAAVIHVLGNTKGGRYGWPIQRCDVYVKTKDGRTATVTEYWLSDDAINHGLLIGSAEFCDDVRDARALARAHAAASR